MNNDTELIAEIRALRAEVAALRGMLASRPYTPPFTEPQPWVYPQRTLDWWRYQPHTGTWTAPTFSGQVVQ